MAARMSVSTGKMAKVQEQVQSVLWLAELQSVTSVQRRFRTRYGCHPPTRKRIRFWDNKLRTTGSLLRVKSPGKRRTSIASEKHFNEARVNQFVLQVYCYKFHVQQKLDNVQLLKDRIRDTLATVTPNMLQSTWNEVEYRLDIWGRILKSIED
ncbi:hypothetical protein C0J52_18839 [Blattella germanica]|nr:hypothetical protein C0J52_18839 [Blattella germanica]